MISVVIPCYNSSGSIDEVVSSTRAELCRITSSYQIILVNDGSTDDVGSHIDALCDTDSCVVGIELSRNCGQHSAILAGLSVCRGDIVVGMDDDLQVRPSDIGRLVAALNDDYDLVYASFPSKKHSRFRNVGSWLFQKTMRALSDRPDITTSSFWAAKRFLVDSIVDAPVASPHLSSLFLSVTDKVANVECDHRERSSGKSGYTLSKLVRLWSTCIDYSTRPAELMIGAGAATGVAGLVGAIVSLCVWGASGETGAAIWCLAFLVVLCCGIVTCCCGMSVLYVSRMFMGQRPFSRFVIRSARNLDNERGISAPESSIGSDGEAI